MTAPIVPERDSAPKLGTRVPVSEPRSYRDSLNAITGRPLIRARVPWLPGESVKGRYIPGIDALLLRKINDEDNDERYVEAHEAGHRLALTSPDRGVVRQHFRDYLKAHPKRLAQGYAAKNQDEQFAEAFANAVEFLDVSRLPEFAERGLDPAQNLDERDQRIPGTKAMVAYLLAKPLYENHPHRGTSAAIGVPAVHPSLPSVVSQRDATRVVPRMPIGPRVLARSTTPRSLFGGR